MKRVLIVLLFLLIPFSTKPSYIFAQPAATASATISATQTNPTPNRNIFQIIWDWLFGLFVKTDYTISTRSFADINSDMTDYGDKDSADFQEKHSFAGSRSSDAYTQNCYKGNVIKKVILNTFGYPDSQLAEICMDLNDPNQCLVKPLKSSCTPISISDLANYFVQINKKFYCDSNNKLTETEQIIRDKVSGDIIAENQLSCYQQIYDDLYLTPKDSQDQNEENTKKMIQTPISAKDQTDGSSQEIQNQLNRNFIPEGSKWDGLNSLRPEAW